MFFGKQKFLSLVFLIFLITNCGEKDPSQDSTTDNLDQGEGQLCAPTLEVDSSPIFLKDSETLNLNLSHNCAKQVKLYYSSSLELCGDEEISNKWTEISDQSLNASGLDTGKYFLCAGNSNGFNLLSTIVTILPSASLKFWVDANRSVKLDTNGKVESWQDLSLSKFHAYQDEINYRPFRGEKGILFDGEDDFLESSFQGEVKTIISAFRVGQSQDENELGQVWGHYAENLHLALDPRSGNARGFSFDGKKVYDSAKAKISLDESSYSDNYFGDTNYIQWNEDEIHIAAAEFEEAKDLSQIHM